MENYTASKVETDENLKDLDVHLDMTLCNLRLKGEDLMKHHDQHLQRKQELMSKNKVENVCGPDMIKLNVGGTKMEVQRNTLTMIKGSRLESLFSGRWDKKLLRDDDGFVFMDLDLYYFKQIIEYLYFMKISKTVNSFDDMPKNCSPDRQNVLNVYLDFFHLRANKSEKGCDSADSDVQYQSDCFENLVQPTDKFEEVKKLFKKEQDKLALLELHVKEMEKNLKVEEDFVGFFHHNLNKFSKGDKVDTDEQCKNKTLNLWVDGEIIQTKQSTLCLYEDSYFAKCFCDEKWIGKSAIITEGGKDATLIELPGEIFKAIINQLRLIVMLNFIDEETIVPPPANTNNPEVMALLKQFVFAMFPDNEDIIMGRPYDSKIISYLEYKQLKKWLKEVNRTKVLNLLYRATRDGWKAKDFHSRCDDKGATLTIIKTSKGYIFGGYSDHSWRSGSYKTSNEAFMFSLKCHADLPPTKMSFKPGLNHYAIFANFCHGPCFGSGIDLAVGFNGDLKSGYTNPGCTFELPSGAQRTLLIGKQGNDAEFQISEVEIFSV
jgi:hypothetical protein